MLRLSRLPVLLCVLLWASPDRADACSCREPPPPTDALTKSSAVFEGKIVRVDRGSDESTAHIEVLRTWKGAATTPIRVSSAGTDSLCGVEFQTGKKYLIYATGGPDSLSTHLCSRTRLSESAGGDFAALGPSTAAKPSGKPLPPPPQRKSGEPKPEPEPEPEPPLEGPGPAPEVSPPPVATPPAPAAPPAPASPPAPAAPPAPAPAPASACSVDAAEGAGLSLLVALLLLGGRRRRAIGGVHTPSFE